MKHLSLIDAYTDTHRHTDIERTTSAVSEEVRRKKNAQNLVAFAREKKNG